MAICKARLVVAMLLVVKPVGLLVQGVGSTHGTNAVGAPSGAVVALA